MHLSLVYNILMIILCSSGLDSKNISQHIDKSFIFNLVRNIQSEDSREREYVKNIIFKLYSSYLILRREIKKNIEHLIIDLVYDDFNEEGNGISEILQILASIIKGFNVPLKEENLIFFKKYLLSLHRLKSLPAFHQQLSICMQNYLKKDINLFSDIFLEINRHWPIVNSIKQVNCLNEFEEVFLYS